MNPVAKRAVTALSVAAVVVAAILLAPPRAVAVAVSVLGVLAAAEYAALLAKRLRPASAAFAAAFAAGSAAIALSMWVLAAISAKAGGTALLYAVAIVKISDMGGFAFGLAFGRHKMCPSVSPNKTWEGFAGSVFASCLVSVCFASAMGFAVAKALALGAAAAATGTAGDLVESKFKRWAGVKDSSAFRFTNGMGGILDMIDSLLFAPAIVYLSI